MPWESKDIWHYMDHIAQQVPIGLLNCGCCPLHQIRLIVWRESLTLIFSTINPQCLKGSFIWLTALSLQNLYLQNLHALIYMALYTTDWPGVAETTWTFIYGLLCHWLTCHLYHWLTCHFRTFMHFTIWHFMSLTDLSSQKLHALLYMAFLPLLPSTREKLSRSYMYFRVLCIKTCGFL